MAPQTVGKQEREIVNLRSRVARFQRQIFGPKYDKHHPEPEGVQGIFSVGFNAIPDPPLAAKKTVVAHMSARPSRSTLAPKDTQALSFPPAPVGVIVGSRADVSGKPAALYPGSVGVYLSWSPSRRITR